MKTILVTGTAGFVGFHVARALLEAGARVIGLDSFDPYYAVNLKMARTAILGRFPEFILEHADLADKAAVQHCFAQHSPEVVCHLAAQAGVRYSLKNPYAFERSNLAGFLNVIEETRKHDVERFVYASSSSVYAGNTKVPYSETDPVNTPVSLYAATKRANELMAYTYTHLWGLKTVGLRFFTVYGPWGRPDMAYWSFLEAIVHKEPIKVFNYGKNRRDFTYIDDVVQGVLGALSCSNSDPYEIINLGNNEPVELMDFIGILEDLAGMPAVKEMVPAQPGDMVETFADIDKAAKKLGFRPSISLRKGLEYFADWYFSSPEITRPVREFRKAHDR
ncbi:MAG: NAD-dependent epimerase/dehydratase family protein [Thermodesulfobacteriota bacterium]